MIKSYQAPVLYLQETTMPNLFLLLALWPLVCCEKCDYTAVCVTASVAAAAVLYVVASIVHELRLLAIHRHN